MRRSLLSSLALALLLAAAPLAAAPLAAHAQSAGGPPEEEADGPGLRFNGLGRAYLQQTELGGTLLETDTVSVESLTDGEFVLDLAANAQPNAVTEVQGVIRLRNEFGGFFGSGVTVEVRELWARGVIADVLRYRVGDMNVALTPYTLFLTDEDGAVNEPELFRPQKQRIYYEEFYTGLNERRMQGARLDFGLAFDRVVEAAEVRGFIARLRATDFTTTPTRLIGGGRVGLASLGLGPYQTRLQAGANLSYTWDDLASGEANVGIRNAVTSLDGTLTLVDRDGWDLRAVGEGGWSRIERTAAADVFLDPDRRIKDTDTFLEIGLAGHLDGPGLTASALFVDVGPDFYSAAAQSKRVDYTRAKTFYDRIGNERVVRRPVLFDLARDPALYTFRIADQLLTYDPRYNNTLPYGRATPNRRGLRLDAAYAPRAARGAVRPFAARTLVALLREIRGQGTTELKDFVLLRGAADLRLDPLVGSRRALGATLGLQYETTRRGGEAVEEVDLTSVLVEAGLSAEVYDRLDLLVGAKHRTSSGRDYVPEIRDFNDVRDFPAPFVTDDQETLWGAGVRYRFAPGIYLTLQYQRFHYGDDVTPADDYRLGQIFALFRMPF